MEFSRFFNAVYIKLISFLFLIFTAYTIVLSLEYLKKICRNVFEINIVVTDIDEVIV